jgi:hypothetical protein
MQTILPLFLGEKRQTGITSKKCEELGEISGQRVVRLEALLRERMPGWLAILFDCSLIALNSSIA